VRNNLAQKTYDVFVSEEGRWLIESHHTMRVDAMARAEALLDEKRVAGVRVVAESQRTGEEEVLLEEMHDVGEKPVQIVPIDEAPVCSKIHDFYTFPARQAAGRLLRELLDQRGQTALEFGFDYGALRMLERNDKIFPAAMQRVGGIHARKTGEKATDCTDRLYAAFAQIKDVAQVTGEDRQRLAFLEHLDLAGLVASGPTHNDGARRQFVLGGLALALGQRGDWTDKLALLVELGEKAEDALVTEYIDEIAAEILESNVAVNDLFGGFADAVSAFRGLVHVTQGRCQINNPRSCLTAFNDFMATRPMPLTTSVLLGRVARTLSGIRPMTREGPAAELEAFKGLLRELIEQAGIAGGPRMAGALTGRARMVFADPDDLSVPDALNHILALLPNRAVQLGFLLDVLASPVREKHEQAVLGVLARLVKQLTSLASLFPKDMPPAQVESSLTQLRDKVMSDGLPEKYRNLFSQTLDRLVARGDAPANGADAPMTYKMEDAPVTTATPATPAKQVQRREAAPGEVLFEEGDEADAAYLILDGEVDIYRKAGNQEVLLATLKRGDIVGEMSLIDNQPRMASARIKSDTKMTVISREDLAARLGRLGETDKVLRRIIDVFVDRLRGQARMYE
tara:strand:+ start:4786 stop:6663 length:1878 start_codon:yes stop_codon:yes gene_type:complete